MLCLGSTGVDCVKCELVWRDNFKLEDLKRSPDLLINVKIGHGQLRLIIQTYFVLPYMGMVAILVKYHIYIYWILHMKFELKQPSDFGEKWCLDMYVAVQSDWPWM